MIVNYSEVAVKSLLDEVLDHYTRDCPGLCRCQRCRDDIMALALNSLPVKYVVSDQGTIITHTIFESIGGKAQVTAALISAIQKVARNPNH